MSLPYHQGEVLLTRLPCGYRQTGEAVGLLAAMAVPLLPSLHRLDSVGAKQSVHACAVTLGRTTNPLGRALLACHPGFIRPLRRGVTPGCYHLRGPQERAWDRISLAAPGAAVRGSRSGALSRSLSSSALCRRSRGAGIRGCRRRCGGGACLTSRSSPLVPSSRVSSCPPVSFGAAFLGWSRGNLALVGRGRAVGSPRQVPMARSQTKRQKPSCKPFSSGGARNGGFGADQGS